MIRQDMKNSIKALLQGTAGIKSIFTARQKVTQNQQMPCITVYLPDIKETVLSGAMPMGKRKIDATALLEIIMIDVGNSPDAGEATFDNMLDAIDEKLRSDPSLGGTVQASAITHIETHVGAPQLVEGQNIFRVAIKKFDVTRVITGIN